MNGLGDMVTPSDGAEGVEIQSKEMDFSLRPGTCNMLESQEMLIPSEGNFSRNSKFRDILNGEDVSRCVNSVDASDPPSASRLLMDDAGAMVQELTGRKYNGANLTVVGTSNNKAMKRARQNHWQHVSQLVGGSGSGSSCANTSYRDCGQAMPTAREDVDGMPFPNFLGHKLPSNAQNETIEQLTNAENKEVAANAFSHGGIRAKILSKSAFSEFFVRKTQKGQGIIRRGPPHEVNRADPREQNNTKAADGTMVVSNMPPSLCVKAGIPYMHGTNLHGTTGTRRCPDDNDGITLREWLNVGNRKVNKLESLHIFKQVVDLVDGSHAQGIPFHDIRPSRFKLLPSNLVKYLGSPVKKEVLENIMDQDTSNQENCIKRKRPKEQEVCQGMGFSNKKQKFNENTNTRRWPLFSSRSGLKPGTYNDSNIKITDPQDSLNEFSEYGTHCKPMGAHMSNTAQQHLTYISIELEDKWYRSPEECSGRGCTMSSNIYSLGVLLFELLGHFVSERAHAGAMLDLRNRILPPNFLSENPKEAGFCLWLLHPEPSSRPTTREVLQSEVISELQEVRTDDLLPSIDQAESESELLLHFLTELQEQKQKHASKIAQDLECLETDIEEVERRCMTKCPSVQSSLQNNSLGTNESSVVRNINQLESAYCSMRSRIKIPDFDAASRPDKDILRNREQWIPTQKDAEEHYNDPLGTFFDGVCKFARYSKFEARGILRNGDFNSSSNVICSLSFDRDEDYFAAAGVSKKIKIFEFNALFNDSVDIHYPAVEMTNKSKLSCVSWNHYIRNYLASTDYDGVVKLWDASTGQGFCQYTEHQKRTWSVDFSHVDPTKLVSGSDDCSVKLWNINEKKCLGTIRSIANVCCVQFSPHSSNLLAFGSADYKIYCYDLRNVRTPWCVLTGHDKAVSYVKFLDSETLVSASTDNSIKVWDLNKTNPNMPSGDACSLTLAGHTNEKNFVGLSVADGYIACGSESNEVYAYHKSLPMPITSHKFGSIDPISGKETDDDNGQFVSSVCWRQKSDMVVAANSTGCIKVLEIV